MVVPVPSGRCANYARVTNSLLGSLSHTAIWARLPLLSPTLADAEGTDAEEALIAEVRRLVVVTASPKLSRVRPVRLPAARPVYGSTHPRLLGVVAPLPRRM